MKIDLCYVGTPISLAALAQQYYGERVQSLLKNVFCRADELLLLRSQLHGDDRPRLGLELLLPAVHVGLHEVAEQRVHAQGLGESFPTSIYLQNLPSIQPRSDRYYFLV